jgi:surface antigen
MLNKKCLGAALLAAAAVSGTAMAQDRGMNTAVGAVLGAAVGHSAGGRDGAIVGGVLGAAVGNSISTRDDYRGNRGYASASYYEAAPAYVESRPVYVQQAPAYYEAPRAVYYQETRPVYYNAPRYYREPVVIVEPGRGHHGHGGWHHGR